MQPGARLVNISRAAGGGSPALLDRLKSGHPAASRSIRLTKPRPRRRRAVEFPKRDMTPHIAAQPRFNPSRLEDMITGWLEAELGTAAFTPAYSRTPSLISALIAISLRTNASNSAGVIGRWLPPSARILRRCPCAPGRRRLVIEPATIGFGVPGRRERADPEIIQSVGPRLGQVGTVASRPAVLVR